MVWLPDGEKISKISLFILTECTNVTDGQTDAAWRLRPRLMLASRGKNRTTLSCKSCLIAKGKRTHRIQTSISHLQSSYNRSTLLSSQPYLSSTSSQYPLLICCHSFSPANHLLLEITDRSFSYASPRLWNQLPDSFRQPHRCRLDLPPHPFLNSSLSSSTLSSSITP